MLVLSFSGFGLSFLWGGDDVINDVFLAVFAAYFFDTYGVKRVFSLEFEDLDDGFITKSCLLEALNEMDHLFI